MRGDHIGHAFCNGFTDRHENFLPRVEQLYKPAFVAQRVAWRLGWEFANLLSKAPLRTAKPTVTGSADPKGQVHE